ncbi:hypothetical protein IU474_05455 [Nocardia otitidiscaviarum]|uniref:hypothetical protein n=1 Tax=Nocardia otitidiscaviarum TaxID=1823 RepID=UPI001895892E|nr:hypothetical protein [Nocardia otitidiscaviarum]MBF6236525.1 hypothetical protein [Nocardia otitidiscaviarum]
MDPEIPQAGTAARRAQRGAEREQRRISHGGVDPDYIWRMERFADLTHAEIYARVREMDPAAMHESAETWVGIADSVSGAATGLHITVQSALAEALRGQIAEAAGAAARAFVAEAMDIAEVARNAGHRITAAAYGAEAVRRTVPPPPDSVASPTDSVAAEQYQLALAALEANYMPIYPPAGSGVPAFEPTRSPLDSSGYGSATALPSTTAAGGPFSAADRTGYGARSDEAQDREHRPLSAPTEPTAAAGNSPAPGDPKQPSHTDPSRSEPTLHASPHDAPLTDPVIAPTGMTPDPTPHSPATPNPTAALPHSSTPGPTTPLPHPVIPGPTVLPGAPGTLASPPAPSDPGRSAPGQPTARTARMPTSSDIPPRHGASWLPGMYPPMAAGGSGQDAPRTTPAWLVWNRERELLGDPPPCGHEVIGANIPAARPCAEPE